MSKLFFRFALVDAIVLGPIETKAASEAPAGETLRLAAPSGIGCLGAVGFPLQSDGRKAMAPLCQFSLRSLLLLVALFATSLAAIVQVPHIFAFAVSCVCAVVASLAANRNIKNFRPRLFAVLASISVLSTWIAAWTLLYILSLGPFIALSELDRKMTGQHHLGRLASVYRPAMRLNDSDLFRWYIGQWIPPDAVGLHGSYPTNISQNLVGTWQTGGTQVVNLRRDGTGRAYGSLTTSDVIYFEWASDASKFAIYQYASKRSASAWLGCAVMNSIPTDSYKLVEFSATHFELHDKSGRIISLTRTHDNKLESAP